MRRNRLSKKFFNIFSDIKFKGLNLSNSEKFIFFWWLFTLISLFFPWLVEKASDWSDEKLYDWFSEKIWDPWIIISIVLVVLIFNLFSKQKKEKIKLYSNFHFNNNSVYVNTWILISVVSIICLNFVSWLKWYSSSIENWNWAIICLTWWVAILLWWLFNRKNNEKVNTYINDIEEDDLNQNIDKTNNMKLPF